jgi:hypothetical protein
MRAGRLSFMVVCALFAVCGTVVQGALTLPPITYVGSFRMTGSFGSYAVSGMAFYQDATGQKLLYHNQFDTYVGNDIPVPLDPGVVTWAGLNTQTTIVGPATVFGKPWANGIGIRDDGTGTDRIYYNGRGSPTNNYTNGAWGSGDLAITASTYQGVGGETCGGVSNPTPSGFVANTGAPAAQDLMEVSTWAAAPDIFLAAPQLGDGTTVPVTEILSLKANAYKNPKSHYGYQAIEWVQPLGTSNWQDGFVVLTEIDSGPQALNWSLVFFDPAQLPYIGGWDINEPDYWLPADGARFDIDPYLSPGLSNRGLVGMAFDPATGMLYVGEDSGNPGDVVHVFQVGVPEPITLALLTLGSAVLLRRPRRGR